MKKQIITIGILVLLVWVGWFGRAFLIARKKSQMNACVGGNVRMIDIAKEQWAFANKRTNGPVDLSGIMVYFIHGRMYVCPEGGEYTFGDIGETPSCSLHGTIDNRRYGDWWKR